MNKAIKAAIDAAIDRLESMSDEDFRREMNEAREDPLYGMLCELEEFSKFLYAEYDPNNYIINMSWGR